MSENQQEQASEATRIPPSPGHHGGAPPVAAPQPGSTGPVDESQVDEAGAGHPHKVEPRAGRDS